MTTLAMVNADVYCIEIIWPNNCVNTVVAKCRMSFVMYSKRSSSVSDAEFLAH